MFLKLKIDDICDVTGEWNKGIFPGMMPDVVWKFHHNEHRNKLMEKSLDILKMHTKIRSAPFVILVYMVLK